MRESAMNNPEVSVILPTFDRLKYLKKAVDSVISQTYPHWELIIADDGSGDETQTYLKQIRDPRATVIWLPHSGNPAAVRNNAIQKARGQYLAFLDSDDLWMPRKLERQLELMRLHPERRWSYTSERPID